jgi:hypothetical protein
MGWTEKAIAVPILVSGVRLFQMDVEATSRAAPDPCCPDVAGVALWSDGDEWNGQQKVEQVRRATLYR